MAVNAKAVVDIDVNDAKFKAFINAFQQFQKALGTQPKAFKTLSADLKAMVQQFQQGTNALIKNADLMRKIALSAQDTAKHHKSTEHSFREMAKHSREMVKHGIEHTKQWKERALWAVAFATGAEFFGIERLGQFVGRGSRQAAGHGLKYGEQKSLEHFADKFGLDANSMAANAATAGETSWSQQGVTAARHGFADKRGLDAIIAQMDTIRRLGKQGEGPSSVVGLHGMSAFGYGEEQVRRINKMSDQDYIKEIKKLREKSKEFEVTEKAQKSWIEFIASLDSFSERIKTIIANNITKILPIFEAAMKKFIEWFGDFMTSPAVQKWIDDFPKWAESVWESIKVVYEHFKQAKELIKPMTQSEAEADRAILARNQRDRREMPTMPTLAEAGGSPEVQERIARTRYRLWASALRGNGQEPPMTEEQFVNEYSRRGILPGIGTPGTEGGVGGNVIGNFAGGGRVKRAGTIRVHGGERVIPSKQVDMAGMSDMDRYMSSIGAIESSSPYGRGKGNYQTLGPVLKSGDQAYGKYQVMRSNIASWTKKVLGYSMTPEQFLADSSAQDEVFAQIFGADEKKYGAVDAASIWFSGRRALGNNASDPLGTSVPGYLKQFVMGLSGQFAQNVSTLNIMDQTGGNVAMSMTSMGAGGVGPAPSFPL